MKASYQRELYRSRICCELEGEEADCGYPLQMCLRNSIPGLLPCSAESMDGRTYICWDVTSRNSLKELSGGGFSPELLKRVLRAVYAVMRELDSYLISSGYLVLLPEQIYLDASRKKVAFICDYEDGASFQIGIQKLAEYILAGIDHKDQEQMRLGYGLYRLAVQENFPREEFQRLLFGGEKQDKIPASGMDGHEGSSGSDTVYGKEPVRENGIFSESLSKDAVAGELERQKILDSFFTEDEEERQGAREYLWLYVLLAAMVVFGLEVFVYFRNGRHIHPGWLVFGLLLTAVCIGAVCVGRCIKNRGEEIQGKLESTKRLQEDKETSAANDGQSGFVSGQTAGHSASPFQGTDVCGGVGETMVLQDPRLYGKEEGGAVLEPMGRNGNSLIIPAKGAVLGKLPDAADIILPYPAVSRIHARIIRQGEKYLIQDLNSRNGTRINGSPLVSQQFVQLKEQDEISFADISYRFLTENGNETVTVQPRTLHSLQSP